MPSPAKLYTQTSRLPRARDRPRKRLQRRVAGVALTSRRRPARAQRSGGKALTSTHLWASANATAQSASASSMARRAGARGRERGGGRAERRGAGARRSRRPGLGSRCETPGFSFLWWRSAAREGFEPAKKLEDVALSKLLKTTQGPRGHGQPGRETRGGAQHQPLFGLQKSQRCRRPPRNGPAPAHPGPPSRRFRPPPLRLPRAPRPQPPLWSDCLGQEMPPSARGRGPGHAPAPALPAGTAAPPRGDAPPSPHPSRLRALGCLPSPGAPGSGSPAARGLRARLTYQE